LTPCGPKQSAAPTPCPQQDGAREYVRASQQPSAFNLDPPRGTLPLIRPFAVVCTECNAVHLQPLLPTKKWANLPAFIEQLGTQRECRAAGPRAALRSWTELGAMCTALSQPLPRTKTPTKTRTMLSSSCTACITATTQTCSKSMTGAAYWSSRQINDQRCLLDSPPPAPATRQRPSARSPTPPYCKT